MTDVWEVIQARRGVARNTIDTLMVRLQDKGWLTSRQGAGRILYKATASQEQSERQAIQQFVDTFFDGSASKLVLTLLDGGSISAKEAKSIRELIDSAKSRKS